MKRFCKKVLSIALTVVLSLGVGMALIPIEADAVSGLLWPVPASLKMSQPYSSSHNGIDISNCSGKDIVAAYDGTVYAYYNKCQHVSASCTTCDPDGYGVGLVIKHSIGGTTYYTHYGHMLYNSIPSKYATRGTAVSKGDVIGKVGASGLANGPHLHFSIAKGSNAWGTYLNATPTDSTKHNYYSTSGTSYVYDSSSGDSGYIPGYSVSFSFPTDSTYVSKYSVGATNAVVVNKITRDDGGKIEKVGVNLYNYNGVLLGSKEDATSSNGVPFHLWYDINSELGITLTKGTVYKYQFYAVHEFGTTKSTMYSFTTTGNYTVSFNANGGTTPTSSKTATCGNTYGTLPTPTRSGYIFNGWYTAASGGTKVTASSVYSLTSNQTLYAHWTRATVTSISISKLPAKTTYVVGETLNTAGTVIKVNYSDGSYETVTGGLSFFPTTLSTAGKQTITVTYSGKTCTFTVDVSALKYTVSYNANGGTGAPENQTKTQGQSLTLSYVQPERAGYVFVGWAESSSAASAEYVSGDIYSADRSVTLYAVWKERVFSTAKLFIKTPSITTVNYGDTLVLHAQATDLPAGAKIEWRIDNGASGFKAKVSDDGYECYVTATSTGKAVFYALAVGADGEYLTDSNGNIIMDEQELTAKGGFFQMIISFFKNLFGADRIIPQMFKYL